MLISFVVLLNSFSLCPASLRESSSLLSILYQAPCHYQPCSNPSFIMQPLSYNRHDCRQLEHFYQKSKDDKDRNIRVQDVVEACLSSNAPLQYQGMRFSCSVPFIYNTPFIGCACALGHIKPIVQIKAVKLSHFDSFSRDLPGASSEDASL